MVPQLLEGSRLPPPNTSEGWQSPTVTQVLPEFAITGATHMVQLFDPAHYAPPSHPSPTNETIEQYQQALPGYVARLLQTCKTIEVLAFNSTERRLLLHILMWAERSGILLEPNDIAKRIRFVSTALPPGIPPLPDGRYFPRYLPVIQSIALRNPTVLHALHPDTI